MKESFEHFSITYDIMQGKSFKEFFLQDVEKLKLNLFFMYFNNHIEIELESNLAKVTRDSLTIPLLHDVRGEKQNVLVSIQNY